MANIYSMYDIPDYTNSQIDYDYWDPSFNNVSNRYSNESYGPWDSAGGVAQWQAPQQNQSRTAPKAVSEGGNKKKQPFTLGSGSSVLTNVVQQAPFQPFEIGGGIPQMPDFAGFLKFMQTIGPILYGGR